jgi:SAM-dependent methyltransferase
MQPDVDAREFYDELGPEYDRMVSWEARLAREEPFFRSLFAERGVRRVLDAACGTGMHALMFARQGLAAAGADVSPEMIARARTHAREAGLNADFEVAGFGGMAARFSGVFDAVTCLGNSLPHILDPAELHACLADFAALLRPGGTLVIQNRNYDRVLEERQRVMPVTARADGEGETLFLRLTEFAGLDSASEEEIRFTLVVLRKRGGAWTSTVQSTPLRALRRAGLEAALAAAGFEAVQVYGGFGRGAYDAPGAADLLVVATRGRPAGPS